MKDTGPYSRGNINKKRKILRYQDYLGQEENDAGADKRACRVCTYRMVQAVRTKTIYIKTEIRRKLDPIHIKLLRLTKARILSVLIVTAFERTTIAVSRRYEHCTKPGH